MNAFMHENEADPCRKGEGGACQEIALSHVGKFVLHLKGSRKVSGLCLSGRSQIECH